MSVTDNNGRVSAVAAVRFTVELNWRGMVTFYRDQGCGRAAVLAMCRAIVGRRALVCDVTPVEVDELAKSMSGTDPEWEDRTLRFTVVQRSGGCIEVERDCGCSPQDVVDLCESLLDEPYLNELDDTGYYRRTVLAG